MTTDFFVKLSRVGWELLRVFFGIEASIGGEALLRKGSLKSA